MSAVSSQKSRLLIGDFSLSAMLRSIDHTSELDLLDSTVLTSTAKETIVGGDGSKLTAGGLLDMDGTALTGQLGQMDTWKSATTRDAVSYGPSGLALGSELLMIGAFESSMKFGAKRGEVVGFDLEAMTDGRTDMGVSLHDLTAETVDVSGTGVDGIAATTNGAVAHLHVTAFSGLTSAVVIVEDSANNSTWATIGTFATATAQTSERLIIAGTVRRYTRYSVDVTGTGSVTFQVGLARR